MYLDKWMSNFYGMSWYRLETSKDLTLIGKEPSMYEWRISVDDFESILDAQNEDFMLVETFIEFSTRVKPNDENYDQVRLYDKKDLPSIYELNEDVMCKNTDLRTRLNNLKYFNLNDCGRYYKSAIDNSINDSNVYACVANINEKVCGYYILKKVDENKFKGMMTGVLHSARGLFLQYKMQQFLINHIGHPFTLINTTQLSNFAVIKNHIRSRRSLSKIEHIFYKKVQ